MKKTVEWNDIEWKEVYKDVKDTQHQLTEATISKDFKRVYRLQRKLITKWNSSCLAVRRVLTSSGKNTPGLDNELWNSSKEKMKAVINIHNLALKPSEYKCKPVKRVYIPKPGSNEKRPLGIPTMIDRALQALYHMCVDPVVEAMSDNNSYGFRKYRSTHDAIIKIKNCLDKKDSPTWILEADIEKCFDKINHNFLIENTIICDKKVLIEWLKSGYSELGIIHETEEGTPQGGVISPLLCNIALNGIEKYVKDYAHKKYRTKTERPKVHLIRYADDFIIIGKSKEQLQDIKLQVDVYLIERGLRFKETKTRIINIFDGFDFLGFNIQKRLINYRFNNRYLQPDVIIIKPNIKSIMKVKDKIKEVTKNYQMPIRGIISLINPILRGWSEYYRISYYSTITFWKLGHYVWYRMMIWIKRKHHGEKLKKLLNKYIIPNTKWEFGIDQKEKIYQINSVTSWSPTLMKEGKNPYNLIDEEYFKERAKKRILARFRSTIYKKNNHICKECGESLYNGEKVELHHIISQKLGGKWTVANIIPLHEICHKKITQNEKKKVV